MNLKTAAIGVVVIVAVGILLGGRINPDDTPTATPTPSTAMHTPSAHQHPTPPHTHEEADEGDHGPEAPVVITPSYDGGEDPDWTVPPAERNHAIDTAETFIAGWLNPDPTQRTQQIQSVAAEALVAELAAPDLRIWATTPQGPPLIMELVSTNAMLRQTFADGRAIDLLLIVEPGSSTGWIVTDIAPAPLKPQ
ncbi:hypothetical protein GCM10025789_31070 [Tessaracoccus lubricantis]|uniref:Uncharacterized protein n=1 Tax=Tessaracoccus lubricantis TaxID=545543 RepID=A0ABP9FNS6_9ACTN